MSSEKLEKLVAEFNTVSSAQRQRLLLIQDELKVIEGQKPGIQLSNGGGLRFNTVGPSLDSVLKKAAPEIKVI